MACRVGRVDGHHHKGRGVLDASKQPRSVLEIGISEDRGHVEIHADLLILVRIAHPRIEVRAR